jgi:hypothetical protein
MSRYWTLGVWDYYIDDLKPFGNQLFRLAVYLRKRYIGQPVEEP